MKKKIITLLITSCLSLFITACVTNKVESESLESVSEEIDMSQNVYLSQSTFCKTSEDIAQIIYGKDVNSYSKNISGFIVDIFPLDDYLIFFVTSNGDDFPSMVYAYDQAFPGTTKYTESLISPFLNTLTEIDNIRTGSYNLSLDSSNRLVYVMWIDGSTAENFPLTIQIPPDSDYFISTDTEEYKLACSEGRYNDILSDVQSYIDNTDPPGYDNAYVLQSVLTPIVKNWENISVEYDSVENYATFKYSKVDKINDKIHFVPYASTKEKNIHLLIGFYDNDWLFFENIIISSIENINISASNGKIEEVTNGGKIYEAYDISLDDKMLEKLLQHSDYTIRFKSNDGTFNDYNLSTEEYDALVCIAKFQNIRNILSDLLFRFNKRLP